MIVEVYCADEYYDEYPPYAKITFTLPLIKRILELHKTLLEIKAGTISEQGSVEYVKNEEGEEYEVKIDYERIHIQNYNFVNWDAFIKNTNIRIYTDDIGIDEIKEIHQALKTPKKKLPLLIGNLKSEEANEILEKRLKNESNIK